MTSKCQKWRCFAQSDNWGISTFLKVPPTGREWNCIFIKPVYWNLIIHWSEQTNYMRKPDQMFMQNMQNFWWKQAFILLFSSGIFYVISQNLHKNMCLEYASEKFLLQKAQTIVSLYDAEERHLFAYAVCLILALKGNNANQETLQTCLKYQCRTQSSQHLLN